MRDEELERWIRDAPRRQTAEVSLRGALRVFPLVMTPIHPQDSHIHLAKVQPLRSFRVTYLAWVLTLRRNNVRSSRFGFQIYGPVSPESESAADAIEQMLRALESRSYVGRAVSAAAKTAYVAGGSTASNILFDSISADIAWLRSHPKGSLLSEPRLWLNKVGSRGASSFPSWISRPLISFQKDPAIPRPWKVWIDWYVALLNGEPINISGLLRRDVSTDILLKLESFWERSPDRVMTDIANLVSLADNPEQQQDAQTMKRFIVGFLQTEKRPFSIDEIDEAFAVAGQTLTRPSIRGRLNSLTYDRQIKRVARGKYASLAFEGGTNEVEAVPSQGPGPHFRANEGGRVDRAPPSESDSLGNDSAIINQLKPLVLRCGLELQTRLSRNEFPELLDATVGYLSALDRPANDEIEWGEVWGLGVVLQNAAASAKREISSRTLPELEDPAKTALDSLLTLHGPMILATREGVALSQAAAANSR